MMPSHVLPLFVLHTLLQGVLGEVLLPTKYCNSDRPLDTPYFIPFNKTVKSARGCVSPQLVSQNTQVHVIRLEQAGPNVYLHVNGSEAHFLSLVLSSPGREVTWHLTTQGFLSLPDILVSDGSRVVRSTDGRILPARPAALDSKTLTHKLAIARFSHITTFTTIETANGIFINLPPEFSSHSTCDHLHEMQEVPSPAVTAFLREKQSAFGCYHPEAAGLQPNDVHVIDLRNLREPSEASDIRYKRSVDQSYPKDVVVELTGPGRPGTEGPPLPRNLTLVLKSDRPVRWLLKSHGIQGRLIVTTAGENPVENLSVGSSQQLDIQKTEIPDQFERLMKEVTQQYGSPLSYMKVHHANLLEMTIPPRSKRELSNPWERNHQPAYSRDLDQDPPADMLEDSQEDLQDKADNAGEVLMGNWVKFCDEEQKKVSIAVPSDLVQKLGVGRLTLNDASCLAELVEDNWWNITSHITSCGSTASTYAEMPMYRNNLWVHFNKGSLSGLQTSIPFLCKLKAGIPGFPDPDPYHESEDDVDNFDNPDEDQEMYGLTVRASSAGNAKKSLLLENKSDSARVGIGDTIFVSSSLNAIAGLALAIEHCWLSNTSKVTDLATKRDLPLITAGCPTGKEVIQHWDQASSHSSFSFKVTPELAQYSPTVWLQCKMGLCSATPQRDAGNVLRCVNPQEECGDPNRGPHKETSIQTVTIRGPLTIQQGSRESIEYVDYGWKTEDNIEDKSTLVDFTANQATHTLVEVPVEVAVAISIASFLVGALSTGVLWYLHSRALRLKAWRLQHSGANPSEGAELQAMLDCPAPRQTSVPHLNGGHFVNGSVTTNRDGHGDHNGNVACTTCPLVVEA